MLTICWYIKDSSRVVAEAHSEPCFQQITIFAKSFILEFGQGSYYVIEQYIQCVVRPGTTKVKIARGEVLLLVKLQVNLKNVKTPMKEGYFQQSCRLQPAILLKVTLFHGCLKLLRGSVTSLLIYTFLGCPYKGIHESRFMI